jgi:hypothetical protein
MTTMSRPFSRTAIIPVSFLMFVLFFLSGSPTTFPRGMVLFLIGAVVLTMLLILWWELAPTIVTRPTSAPPLASSPADVVSNSWPNSAFRNNSKRGTRRS